MNRPTKRKCERCGNSFYSVERKLCAECCPVQATVEPVAITAKADQSVEHVLKEMADRADHFSGVIVIAKNKDGGRYMMTSRMSGEDKAGLFCFFQAYLNDIFKVEDA